jgi:hypothetical protein
MLKLIKRLYMKFNRAYWLLRDGAPMELAFGSTILIEKRLVATSPIPLIAQPDAVMLTNDMRLVPVNTKHKASSSVSYGDRVQLAVEAAVLRNTTDERIAGLHVADYGYIRLVHQGQTTYHRIDLLPDADVSQLWLLHFTAQSGSFSQLA